MSNLYKQWLDACAKADIPGISLDTAARLLAILYVYGGENEAMTHNQKFLDEVEYAQNRFGIIGGETPQKDFCVVLRGYIKELEQYPTNNKTKAPEWAIRFLTERYGITLKV